ncbi:hypothetical protein PAXRUDRAFT_611970 [Paxillus rubicundulus Ve08.2h10]|uniref:Uncharacterized protein n=1 Tax=Paxillus rubicundulus Ve08.2h10 TaxID=930991 RepID=A0A0D0D586_9AGAM|nr:hypothetical protein PAXRUDRAFT_611970 [Paxillus rubicundulus Ve08.2h10]
MVLTLTTYQILSDTPAVDIARRDRLWSTKRGTGRKGSMVSTLWIYGCVESCLLPAEIRQTGAYTRVLVQRNSVLDRRSLLPASWTPPCGSDPTSTTRKKLLEQLREFLVQDNNNVTATLLYCLSDEGLVTLVKRKVKSGFGSPRHLKLGREFGGVRHAI